MAVTLDAVKQAAKAVSGQIERTPCRLSRTLSNITGAEIWVKFENLQFTAAFKERGALNKLVNLSEEARSRGVIAMSAGNHAQGLAYHGARLEVPVTIVMPKNTPFVKVEHTRNFGARVLLEGNNLTEATEFAHSLCEQENLTFVHPFNDHDVIAGQGTVGLELLEDAPDLDTVIIPVGGGGLISGVATAVKSLKPEISVVGVEPRFYPSMSAALDGREAHCDGFTIAEGIAVKTVGDKCLKIVESLVDDVMLVEESHLERAIALFATVEKTIAEGAGAAGLAALLAHPDRFIGRRVGLILCGGNIDTRLLASVLTRSLVREQRLVSVRIVGSDQPGFLADVGKIIGDAGANIIEVAHNRLALDVPAKGAEFDLLVETRDAIHTNDILEALRAGGYPPRVISA